MVEKNITNETETLEQSVQIETEYVVGETIIPEITVPCADNACAFAIQKYARGLGLKAMLSVDDEEGIYDVVILNISDTQLAKINAQFNLQKIGNFVKSSVNATADFVTGTGNFVVTNFAIPTAKGAIKTTLGVGTIAAKAISITASTAVGSTISSVKDTYKTLSADDDVIKCKKELKSCWNGVQSLYNKIGGSTGDRQIITGRRNIVSSNNGVR